MTTPLRGAFAAFSMAMLLAGCGSDQPGSDGVPDPSVEASTSQGSEPTGSPSPTEAPSTEDAGAEAPVCGHVWEDGSRLPKGYQGCNEGSGASRTFVPRHTLSCSSGQRMVTYADHYYTVLGGIIHSTESRLVKDPEYGNAVARCRG